MQWRLSVLLRDGDEFYSTEQRGVDRLVFTTACETFCHTDGRRIGRTNHPVSFNEGDVLAKEKRSMQNTTPTTLEQFARDAFQKE